MVRKLPAKRKQKLQTPGTSKSSIAHAPQDGNVHRASPRTPKSPSTPVQQRTSQTSSKQSSQEQSTTRSNSRLSQQLKKSINNPKKKIKRKSHDMLVGNKIFKVSHKILKEIKRFQTSTQNLIPKLPFSRLIHEITGQYVPSKIRIQRVALEALQEAAEAYLVQFFEDCYSCCLHARRCTLIPRDMGLVQYLRKSNL